MSVGARKWLESLLVTLAIPAIGMAVAPLSSGLSGEFPWWCAAPLLVALQHGLAPGLTSAAVLVGGAEWLAQAAVHPSPGAPAVVACLVAAIIPGMFRDHWNRRGGRLRRDRDELETQLERLGRSYRVLQHSHAELEAEVAADRWSLERGIVEAERRIGAASSAAERAAIALSALVTQAEIQAASIWPLRSRRIAPSPIATTGRGTPCSASHPLLSRALQSRKLCALPGLTDAVADTSVVAAVPMLTADGRALGVLAIHEMPFEALTPRHLQRVQALCARLTDVLAAADAQVRLEALSRAWPPPPPARVGAMMLPNAVAGFVRRTNVASPVTSPTAADRAGLQPRTRPSDPAVRQP